MIPALTVARYITPLQVSTVHCGLCEDPQHALDDLFQRLAAPATPHQRVWN